jgi:phosphoserine phosphatase
VHVGKRQTALYSWNDNAAKGEIENFVARVTHRESPDFIRPGERIAVFDNDGTLWCEKPMPIELGFMLERLASMAHRDATLRHRQPWQAAWDRDYEWLGRAITKHYQGEDADVKVLVSGIVKAFRGWSVEDYEAAAYAYLHRSVHPALGRPLADCVYLPMIDLMRYLEAHGFTLYIVSAGDRDFMRPITAEIYGIPPERVIGSSTALRYRGGSAGGSVVYRGKPEVFDDGAAKPVQIWSRIGRRPVFVVGNSNSDIPMLEYAGGSSRPSLRMLVLHDDEDREFDYIAGAERSVQRAQTEGWTIISMRDDWATVFVPSLATGRV